MLQDRGCHLSRQVTSDGLEGQQLGFPHPRQIFAEAASRRHRAEPQQLRRGGVLAQRIQVRERAIAGGQRRDQAP